MVSSTASAAAQQTGLPPKVVPVLAGFEQPTGLSDADARPDRQAAAEPLRQRHDVRPIPAAWWANHAPGAADPGLHLVDHEQRPAGAVISRAARR
jgi:hypothetical protein